MKKITCLMVAIVTTMLSFAQINSTGPIMVTGDYTIQYDVNTSTNIVTLTMIGPSDRWLGTAISTTSYSMGATMGQFSGDDAITYVNGVLVDRFMPGSNGQPSQDPVQNWTVVSDDVVGNVRTVVGTRARDTGDANDYVFPTMNLSGLTIVWARGGANSVGAIAYHSGGRGATVANFTLSNDEFELAPSFTISPNPARERLNIELDSRIQDARLQVYDVLGKQMINKAISDIDASVPVANWNSGIYIVRVISGDLVQTKRFVKQ